MPIDHELTVFSNVVVTLFASHRTPGTYVDRDTSLVYRELAPYYAAFTDGVLLRRYLPTPSNRETNFTTIRQYLYLNPVMRGLWLLPVLSIKANFERSLPEVRLRLGLFLWAKGRVRSLGMRFETPEGPGLHNYYHMQFIRGFDGGSEMPGSLWWLPTKEPTVPLDADNPVALLLCLLVNLYGFHYLNQLETEVGRELLEFSQALRLQQNQPRFYRVTTAGGVFFYKTWSVDGPFRRWARLWHAGCNIAMATEQDFLGCPEDQRMVR
jgi:hypothetical protein